MSNNDWAAPKSEPATDEQHEAKMCTKCGGSGIYSTMVVNGMPYSPTGTDCYRCRGRGWLIFEKKRDWTQDQATEKQRRYLKSLGVNPTEHLTKSEATNMIKVALESKR